MSTNLYEAVPVTDGVWWVGVIDWDLRDFHGYTTPRGSTYNAYLVRGSGGYVLIDGCKVGFEEELLSRVRSVCDLSEVGAVVSNHAEMDHSSGLSEIFRHLRPGVPLYASMAGVKALGQHFHWDREVIGVKTGTTLELCGREFRFIETKMLHWPDSMFTYVPDAGVLFTNDAFGMHWASHARFSDACDPCILREEAQTYYANILTPYGLQVSNLFKAWPTFDLKLKFVAPDHGPIWAEKDIDTVLSWYGDWSSFKLEKKALIIYATMWGSTRKMAVAIAEGMISQGVECTMIDILTTPRSVVATQLLDSAIFVAGSPTLNNQMYPVMADVMTYVKGLKFKPVITGAFGSHGWASKSVDFLEEELKLMKCPAEHGSMRACYVPSEAVLTECKNYGAKLASALHEAVK